MSQKVSVSLNGLVVQKIQNHIDCRSSQLCLFSFADATFNSRSSSKLFCLFRKVKGTTLSAEAVNQVCYCYSFPKLSKELFSKLLKTGVSLCSLYLLLEKYRQLDFTILSIT